MIVKKYSSREEWLNDKLGKASGSRAKDVMPDAKGNRKKGFWQLVEERLKGSAAINDEENAMARGLRLEPEALARFAKETGKKVDTTLQTWSREDDASIMVTPDGVVGKSAAIEVKCLNGASHAEAMYTKKIPKNTAGYEEQAVQYFAVNEGLKTLYYVFYDPGYPNGLDFFYLTLKRKDYEEQITEQLDDIRATLKDVRTIVNELSLKIKDIPVHEIHVIQESAVVIPTSLKQSAAIEAIDILSKESALNRMYQGMKERASELVGKLEDMHDLCDLN